MSDLVVFIDDIRDFDEDLNSGYPSRDVLVAWANKNNFKWNIEQDIFVAKTRRWREIIFSRQSLELNSINFIKEFERGGSARALFWPWAAANVSSWHCHMVHFS
jgi:hypothetical protein